MRRKIVLALAAASLFLPPVPGVLSGASDRGGSEQTQPAGSGHHHDHLGEIGDPGVGVWDFADAAEADPSGKTGSDVKAVAHHAGGSIVSSPRRNQEAPRSRLYRTGALAAEPTLGVTSKGWIFYTAFEGLGLEPAVMRSKDEGATWEDVSPATGSQKRHVISGDPYTYVDEDTDRVFTIDWVGCHLLSFSDDGGEGWTTAPPAGCGVNTDHQTLFGGPPVSSETQDYPNNIYLCSAGVGTGQGIARVSVCSKSTDGGMTFVPTGEPPYANALDCDGFTAHGYVGRDGTVYLPRGYCGQPQLAISKDEGATWKRVQVADTGMNTIVSSGYPDHEAGVVADGKGNIFYTWVAEDRLPYLTISRDGGESWEEPMMVGAPGLNEANLPGIAIGKDGAIAIVYMGTTESPGMPWTGSYEDVRWSTYITMTTNALAKRPLFYSGPVNDPSDPVIVGTCGPFRCQAEYDFIDIVISPRGEPWAVLVDACPTAGPCASLGEGVVGRLVGGPKLR